MILFVTDISIIDLIVFSHSIPNHSFLGIEHDGLVESPSTGRERISSGLG